MKTVTTLVAILAVFLVIRIVSNDGPDRPQIGHLPPAQSHYVALLDEMLFNFGYAAGMAQSHPHVWAQAHSYVSEDGRATMLLVRYPRPNMGEDEARSANRRRYQEGLDAAASLPFDEADALARLDRVNTILAFELIPAMDAAFD